LTRQEIPIAAEKVPERPPGKLFLRTCFAWNWISPFPDGQLEKLPPGLIVAASPLQVIDEVQGKTVSWQRVAQVSDHCRGERDGIVKRQRCGIAVDLLSQSDPPFQQLLRGGLIGCRKNSRDMHEGSGADSRFRTLRLFAGLQEKLLRHIRRILFPNQSKMTARGQSRCNESPLS
jgi:hypothetical protein